jgi:hypothetical protein
VAHGFQIKLNKVMTTVTKPTTKQPDQPRYKIKSPTRGGARAGAGRPKGSTPRYTLEDLMAQVEHHTGKTFAEQVAINYAQAIARADHAGVRDYDKILLGKMVADKQEVVNVESEDATVAKAAAFAAALTSLSNGRGNTQ